MAQKRTFNIGDLPLHYARKLSNLVIEEFNNGTMLEKVTPTTASLLSYWFNDEFKNNRNLNFNDGQVFGILNTIYIHEVLKANNIIDVLNYIKSKEKLKDIAAVIDSTSYDYKKYLVKLPTGTGKTWVMHALLIWQYLNSKHENAQGFYNKFLIIAPGLIVYDRLLDAFLGKETVDADGVGIRDFDTSDFKLFKELFIPQEYREEVFSFIQNSVVKKKEIGKRATGEGLIAITNWHLLNKSEEDSLDNIEEMIKDILPIIPGKTCNHALDILDNKLSKDAELRYLTELDSIVIFNDEAHHIYDGDKEEKLWNKSISEIILNKKSKILQIDFTATPYNKKNGKDKIKNYFPHIIVDFELKEAIKQGLVKTIVIDKRKIIEGKKLEELDFNSIKDGEGVLLSEGQKLMLKAGVKKIKILGDKFTELEKDKYPKMLVMCENTKVVPKVEEYLLKNLGFNSDEVIKIDSNAKGEVKEAEWSIIKNKVFNIDKIPKPKIIISVLMLREGFDVNNICVIVPLRATESEVLLEQTIGRGLRLMWRDSKYTEIKAESRNNLLEKKEAPTSYLDMLSIIEHPRFIQFYNELIQDNICGVEEEEVQPNKVLGDIIKVNLKDNYKDYDIYIPQIIEDEDTYLDNAYFDINKMQSYTKHTFNELKDRLNDVDNTFYSQEITSKTVFGEYKISAEIFNSEGYNEFLSKLISSFTKLLVKLNNKNPKEVFLMQVNNFELAKVLDNYIRYKLFGEAINPLIDNNWRVLLLGSYGITEHIMKELATLIMQQQQSEFSENVIVEKRYLSQMNSITIRKKYSIEVKKSIFDRLGYPSNKGNFEADFIKFCDNQSEVRAFIKIKEGNSLINLYYIREDGLIARYYPDFIIRLEDKIFVVETKANNMMSNADVIAKANSARSWIERINKLAEEDRMGCRWEYCLISDSRFYELSGNGYKLSELLKY